MATPNTPASGKEYRDLVFTDLILDNEDMGRVRFESCAFERCVFDGGQWKLCRFEQCRFQDCRLLNVKLPSSRFHDVRFTRCKLAGINFGQLDTKLIFSAMVEDCKLLSCTFPRMDLSRCRLTGNEWEDCFFDEANLSGLDFSGAVFGGSRFARCNLEGSDFSDAAEFLLDPRENRLRGAKFSVGSALELLGFFGIVLK